MSFLLFIGRSLSSDSTYSRICDNLFFFFNFQWKHVPNLHIMQLCHLFPFLQKAFFFDGLVHVEKDGFFNSEVYRKPTHTNWYLVFDSPPTETQTSFIRTLHYLVENVLMKSKGMGKVQKISHVCVLTGCLSSQ